MHLFVEKFVDLPEDQKAAKIRVELIPKKLDEEVAAMVLVLVVYSPS